MSKKKNDENESADATDITPDAEEKPIPTSVEPHEPSIEKRGAADSKINVRKSKKQFAIPNIDPLGRKQKAAGPKPLSVLAERFKTPAVVLSALKAEYGWTDKTQLTAERYREAHNNWLAAPAGKRRKR